MVRLMLTLMIWICVCVVILVMMVVGLVSESWLKWIVFPTVGLAICVIVGLLGTLSDTEDDDPDNDNNDSGNDQIDFPPRSPAIRRGLFSCKIFIYFYSYLNFFTIVKFVRYEKLSPILNGR